MELSADTTIPPPSIHFLTLLPWLFQCLIEWFQFIFFYIVNQYKEITRIHTSTNQELKNLYDHRIITSSRPYDKVNGMPMLNDDMLLLYGLYIGIQFNLIDNQNRMRTITHKDFSNAITFEMVPQAHILSYRCGKQRVIQNQTKNTIQIKEYAPQGFAVYRELLSISVESIEQYMSHHWFILNQDIHSNYRIIIFSREQKNCLLHILPSLIVYKRFHQSYYYPYYCCLFRITIKEKRLQRFFCIICSLVSLSPSIQCYQNEIILGEKRTNHHRLRQICELDPASMNQMYKSLCESVYTLYLLQSVRYSIVFHFLYMAPTPQISIVIEIQDILFTHSLKFRLAHLCSYPKRYSPAAYKHCIMVQLNDFFS